MVGAPGPIWLIGMMGSGKSTVAPLVAEALGRDWADTDTMVEQALGMTVSEVFARSEAEFRVAEFAAVERIGATDAVVAAGGGAVTTAASEVISATGTVVWLRATAATLTERIGDPGSRPLLAGGDDGTLARLLDERTSRYAELADVVIDADGLAPGEVAELVVEAWKNSPSAG